MIRTTVLAAALLGLPLFASTAVTDREPVGEPRSDELQALWSEYVANEAQRAPLGKFPYPHCFRRAAGAHGLPLSLLLAVARGESNFQPRARSRANAYGLMQIRWPQTAWDLGIYRLADLFDPCTNVEAGARYLKRLKDRYGGDLHLALAAYNYGPGRIPSDGSRLPTGAVRYSAYVYRHLRRVLWGTEASPPLEPPPFEVVRRPGRFVVITFDNPYRARYFVERLRASAPGLRFERSRTDDGRYAVSLLYAGTGELRRGRDRLAGLGLALP